MKSERKKKRSWVFTFSLRSHDMMQFGIKKNKKKCYLKLHYEVGKFFFFFFFWMMNMSKLSKHHNNTSAKKCLVLAAHPNSPSKQLEKFIFKWECACNC